MKAVNLLPSKGAQRRGVVTTPTFTDPHSVGPLIVIGILTVAVITVIVWVLTNNNVNSRKSELGVAQAERSRLEAQAGKLKPFQDLALLASNRKDQIDRLDNSRFDWEQVLRDLARSVPTGVTLTNVNGSVASDVEGGPTSAVRSAIAAPAIQVQGCAVNQERVAQLMSQLRDIDRVTRVSLSSSDKDTAPSGSSSSATPSSLCSVSPPSFDITAFFEGALQPPSSIGTSSGGSSNASSGGASPNSSSNSGGSANTSGGSGGTSGAPASTAGGSK